MKCVTVVDNVNVATSNSQGPARLPKIKLDKVKQLDIKKFQSFIFHYLTRLTYAM